MIKHTHWCGACDYVWPCIIRIVGGARCEWTYETLCYECLNNMVEHASAEDIASMLEVFKHVDPLSAWRISALKKRTTNAQREGPLS
jgi:hypothetical protein